MNATTKPWWAWGCHDQMTPSDLRNTAHLNLWLLAWMTTTITALLLLRRDFVTAAPWTWMLAVTPTALAVFVIRTYVRLLREADELVRKIHLESMALGFGAGVVFVFAYRLLESVGAPPLGLTDAVMPMVAVYSIAQVLGVRRYR